MLRVASHPAWRRASTSTSAICNNTARNISTINDSEISHFSALAQTWWDERGDFNVLQRMNKVRVQFLRDRLSEGGLAVNEGVGPRFLAGKRVLDVGCGGGLFAEVNQQDSS